MLSLYLIFGFIFHLIGDYLLQNDWMAREKTRNTLACIIHCLLYSALFMFITGEWWLLVFLSHLFIDRFRLAVYWIKLVNWNWKSKNYGFTDDKPQYIAVWLLIIIDNIFHILFNSAAICLHYLN